jgi:8-oxo-dGTP pyrophosphatase MutT (NUDIX family)
MRKPVKKVAKRKPKFDHEYNAGVLIVNEKYEILAVSRQKHVAAARWYYDWGLPGGHQQLGDVPVQTASRGLFEKTGISCHSLRPLITVPAEQTPDGLPYHVYVPAAPWYGRKVPFTPAGVPRWVSYVRFLDVADPRQSVRDSNRFILFWGLGWPV